MEQFWQKMATCHITWGLQNLCWQNAKIIVSNAGTRWRQLDETTSVITYIRLLSRMVAMYGSAIAEATFAWYHLESVPGYCPHRRYYEDNASATYRMLQESGDFLEIFPKVFVTLRSCWAICLFSSSYSATSCCTLSTTYRTSICPNTRCRNWRFPRNAALC